MQLDSLAIGATNRWKNARKIALSILVMLTCLVVVTRQSDQIDVEQISTLLGGLTLWQWLAAAGMTGLSFLAVGQYDALFHRWLRSGVSDSQAITSGATAIALAQTLGFGLATGSLARWRLLPNLSVVQAIKITNYVSFSFMIALGIAVGLLVLLSCTEVSSLTLTLSFSSLAVFLGLCVLSLWVPKWLVFNIPPLGLMSRLFVLTMLDISCAAVALWVLLPDPLAMPVMVFLSAYAISLGAGLLAGTPGGIGPFELCLVALLPFAPEAEVITAVVAFRLIHYAIPACLAACLITFFKPTVAPEPCNAPSRPQTNKRAEAIGLAGLPGNAVAALASGHWLTSPASQFQVYIGDAVEGRSVTYRDLEQASAQARATGKQPAFYKVGAKTALTARTAGWDVLRIANEAVLNPLQFNTDRPETRQLRRKLRKAEKAGVTITEWDGQNETVLTEIAKAWAERMGGEMGFSMGRFNLDYLRGQKCFIAWCHGEIVGFASFHSCDHEWVLDLMRQSTAAPDGTMYALVQTAIDHAKHTNIPRFSLAAVQQPHLILNRWQNDGGEGLRRFKNSFVPVMEPLYLAAPNRLLLALACLDIALRIHHPRPFADEVSPGIWDSIRWSLSHRARLLSDTFSRLSHIRKDPLLSKID